MIVKLGTQDDSTVNYPHSVARTIRTAFETTVSENSGPREDREPGTTTCAARPRHVARRLATRPPFRDSRSGGHQAPVTAWPDRRPFAMGLAEIDI